ncbi:hypothetical protein V7201_21045, partial [Bacillus sp. JJ1122]|uniref:hypothetical protein n=1 Tax=Bacillus sp. JJ1122 TaxID=3122951 RepID=UPI002FFFACCB
TSAGRLKTLRPAATSALGRPVRRRADRLSRSLTPPERTETEMCSRLSRNAETGGSDKEALFASAGGVEVS